MICSSVCCSCSCQFLCEVICHATNTFATVPARSCRRVPRRRRRGRADQNSRTGTSASAPTARGQRAISPGYQQRGARCERQHDGNTGYVSSEMCLPSIAHARTAVTQTERFIFRLCASLVAAVVASAAAPLPRRTTFTFSLAFSLGSERPHPFPARGDARH